MTPATSEYIGAMLTTTFGFTAWLKAGEAKTSDKKTNIELYSVCFIISPEITLKPFVL
jgi:hypothetical protein